jgi:hypothetical protein
MAAIIGQPVGWGKCTVLATPGGGRDTVRADPSGASGESSRAPPRRSGCSSSRSNAAKAIGLPGRWRASKERISPYRRGVRSPAWLKLKPKLTLDVVVTGGSAERIRWGDWGEAVMLAFRYTHPRTGADVEVRQAVRVPRDLPFGLRIGERLALVCWGVMPSGMLRHPLLVRR